MAGDWVRDMALLFWVFGATEHSPMARAGILLAQRAPSLLISPLAGAVADRLDSRRLLLYTDLVRAILSTLQVWALTANNLIGVFGLCVCWGQRIPVSSDRGWHVHRAR